MKKWTLVLTAVLVGGAPTIAIGHPGHGANGGSYSLIHYLTEPVHALASLGIILALGTVLVALRQWRDRLAGRTLSCMSAVDAGATGGDGQGGGGHSGAVEGGRP